MFGEELKILTFFLANSGHMQPQFQPRVAYRHAQWMLGRIDAL